MMISGIHRPAKLVIDQQAIFENVKQAVKRLPADTALWAVVKADGYGHGMVQVAKAAAAAGATGFCVALLDEALGLRQAGFDQPILVLGVTPANQVALAAQHKISLAAPDANWLQVAAKTLQNSAAPLSIHLAFDTGMGRIGVQTVAEVQAAVALLRQAPFAFDGVFTHFSTADEADTTHFNQQVQQFKTLLAAVGERPRYVHVANSATSLWHQACASNVVRFGVAMYGLNPSGDALPLPYPLKPALRFESELTFVKQVPAGAAISYGATYHAAQSEWIGTIPVGYADGWQRRLQGFHVLINGHVCEIVGRICMDQFMVRLPEKLPAGTKVTLVGTEGDASISLQDVATFANTIHYEIACGLTMRLPRVYLPYQA